MTEVATHSSSLARIATPKARTYMVQLCKHFGHKIEASFTEHTGRIVFGDRLCELDASRPGILGIALSAESEASLLAVEDIVARHLVRFAFKEELAIQWVRRN